MKTKLLCLVISLITLLTFSGCGENQTDPPQDDGPHNTASSVETTASAVAEQLTVSDAFIAACNMNEGGYVNFSNGKYYYADAAHDNDLYMSDADGKNAVCIDSDADAKMSRISVTERAVYYIKITNLETAIQIGEYSIPFQKQLRRYCDGEITVLSEENVISYVLSEDYIFYSATDLKIYRMRHDGSEKTVIYESPYLLNLSVSANKLYAHLGERLFTMDFDGKNSYMNRVYLFVPAFDGPTMYFVETNGYHLCKTDFSGNEPQAVIHEEIRGFTVYKGQWVYEQFSKDEIVMADANGENPKVVCAGECPIVLNGYLFYLDDGVIKVADI